MSWLFTSGGQNIGTVKEKKKNQPYIMPRKLEILHYKRAEIQLNL